MTDFPELPAARVLQSVALLGDTVIIDGDTSIRAVVTAVTLRSDGAVQFEVQWLHNGTNQTAWVNARRMGPT